MTDLILYAEYEEIPDYFFDNLYNNCKYVKNVHIITNKPQEILAKVKNLIFTNHIIIIDLFKHYDDAEVKIASDYENFRDGFWRKTIQRYFVIRNYLKKEGIKEVFHIENDVLLFTNLSHIYKFLVKRKDELYYCRDSIDRALGSMLYIPDSDSIDSLCNHMKRELENGFKNDMELLSSYVAESFPSEPNINGIIDACCFGQCLSGVDERNIPGDTIGFINETSDYKPDLEMFNQIGKDWYYGLSKLHTLHIHSKKMYKYTRAELKRDDIIQVDRFANKYPDFYDVDYSTLKAGDNIHIKTDFVEDFRVNYLPKIELPVNLYFSNCDESFKSEEICDNPMVNKIYAMSPAINHKKIQFLPMGMSSNMWIHGNADLFYKTYLQSRKWKKTKNLFVSFNENTFWYRSQLLKGLKKVGIQNKCFFERQEEFWNEMAEHRFVLCPRGNSFDSHRFWEALWLGCVPIIINNSHTNMKVFVNYLRKESIQFVEISFEKMDDICRALSNINKNGRI